MLKRGIGWLWIICLPFSLFAQDEVKDSLMHDSIAPTARQRGFVETIKKFLNFSDFDTTYISPNRYNYALMLDHFTNYEYYSVKNTSPTPQRQPK